jgi:hypothetical protein
VQPEDLPIPLSINIRAKSGEVFGKINERRAWHAVTLEATTDTSSVVGIQMTSRIPVVNERSAIALSPGQQAIGRGVVTKSNPFTKSIASLVRTFRPRGRDVTR